MIAATKPSTCITAGCKNQTIARGLCQACFQSAKRLVRDQVTDWPELERKQLCKPVGITNGRKGTSLFLKAFTSAIRSPQNKSKARTTAKSK